jgi:hypothetical protein
VFNIALFDGIDWIGFSPVRQFKLARTWSGWVAEEFNDQVDKERELGIQVSAWMEARDALSKVNNEIHFLKNISLPMWEVLIAFYPSLGHLVEQLNDNISEYELLKKKFDFHDNILPKLLNHDVTGIQPIASDNC